MFLGRYDYIWMLKLYSVLNQAFEMHFGLEQCVGISHEIDVNTIQQLRSVVTFNRFFQCSDFEFELLGEIINTQHLKIEQNMFPSFV